MSEFSLRTRHRALECAAESLADILVVGGGITGSGVAREAALRGYKVLLVDKGDFASGTSSRSSKLIHGGVRYLAQGDVALVKEAARERAVLRLIAPHLVTPVRMLIPVASRSAKLKMAAGLWTFDRLAGNANEPHLVLERSDVLDAEGGLRPEHVSGGVAYTEYITDDARLTLETVRSAAAAGAWVANYAEVVDVREHAAGVRAGLVDWISGERLVVRARCLVNAAGPWFDQVRGLSEPGAPPLLQLTRGIHLVFRRSRLPIEHAVVLRAPDGRSTFVVPKGEYAYVGTTDTMYAGEAEEPGVSWDDACYLHESLRATFIDSPGPADVIGTWAGVRPLLRQNGKTASEISRRDEVHVGPGPIVAIAGGKLTTYRRMAERVLEKVAAMIGGRSDLDSASIALVGGDRETQRRARAETTPCLDAAMNERLWTKYGTGARELVDHMRENPESATSLGGLSLTRAEIAFAVEHEMVSCLDDMLRRRSSVGLFDIEAAVSAAPEVAKEIGVRLGWSAERIGEEVSRFTSDRMAELKTVTTAGIRGAA
jgi:glycerol-3-phosphate dehydrogenase